MGKVQVLQLEVTHGRHYHLQHAVGHCAESVEERGRQNQSAVAFSLLVLVSTTVIVGYGNFVGGSSR